MLYVWSGPPDATPPACPDPTSPTLTGYLDTPPDSISCTPCNCGASDGSCFLPNMISANSAACPATGSGVTHTPFNGPDVWDGTCTTENAVASAGSVTLSRASLATGAECAPSNTKVDTVDGVKTVVLGCGEFPNYYPDGLCPDKLLQCSYPKVEGFEVCIVAFQEDVPCPAEWPNRHLYYDDSLMCRCTCGDPSGEQCTATVTAYGDSACQTPLGSASVTSDDTSKCFNVPAGSSLGSKSATLTYKAGTCAPTLKKASVSILCCLP